MKLGRYVFSIIILLMFSSCSMNPEKRLSEAITDGKVARVEWMARIGALRRINDDSFNPLGLSLQEKNLDISKILLANGVDPNKPMQNNEFPINYSMRNHLYQFTQAILELGTNLNIQTINTSLLYELITSDLPDEMQTSLVELMITKGLNPNIKIREDSNSSEKTLLYVAVQGHQASDPELVRFLISHGADMYDRTDQYMSSFEHAIASHDIEVLKVFFDEGIDTNRVLYPWSTFAYSWRNARFNETGELLLENGMRNHPNTATILHLCVSDGLIESLRWFLSHGFDVNKTDENGDRPIDILRIYGLDSKYYGINPLPYYRLGRQVEDLLLQYGSKSSKYDLSQFDNLD